MGSGSWKLETRLAAGGLPEFLRRLADALENGSAGGPAEQLAGMPAAPRKLVLVAEAKSEGHELKLKAKREGEVRVPTKPAMDVKSAKTVEAAEAPKPTPRKAPDQKAARARDKYRQLKKTMQADYKALRKAAEDGAMPPQDVLESFLALCEAMAEMEQPLTEPHGPEGTELARANAAFVEDAKALRAAMSARKAPALLEVLNRLERRKSACHAQFKPLAGA